MLYDTLRLPSSFSCGWLFFIGLLTWCPTPASAQGKNFEINSKLPSWIIPIHPKNIKPEKKDISDGYYLSLYENQTQAELEEEYRHTIREIVSDAGVQNGSQISVTYDPSFQKLIFHKVLLWRNTKSIDQLKSNKFKVLQNEKSLSKFIYSGTYDAFLLLEDVRKGDRIEYAYTIKGNNPIFGKKISSTYYIEGSSTLGQLYMNLITSKSRKLNIKNFNGTPPPRITEVNGLKLYEWNAELTKTYRINDFEPSWYRPLQRAQVTEYNNWNEVVNWGLSVNDYPDLKSPLVDQKVKELKSYSGKNQKKYIEMATRFVQDEIRYMGIEMGVYSHRPNSPEKVLKQRYGDCKDKSLLLIHLLRGFGINAYMVYADTESTIKTNENLPSPYVFNHVIVMIDYAGRNTWVDPTISYQRDKFDDFQAPDYGYVLVIKPGVSTLKRMESKPKGKLISELTFNIADTVGDAKSTLVVSSKYTGNYANYIRSAIAESGTDGLEKDYVEYYTKYYPELQIKNALEISDDEQKNEVELTESYEITNIWTTNEDGNQQLVYFYGDLVANELHEVIAKKRAEPLSLKHPTDIEQNITVFMPFTYNSQEEKLDVKNDNYSFDFEYQISNNTASFNYKFKSLRSYLPGAKIKDYIKDYKRVTENLTYTISSNGSANAVPDGTNKYALLIFIVTLVISSVFFIGLFRKSGDFDIEQLSTAKPIGGWLILLAIRVAFGPITVIFKIVSPGLLDANFYKNLAAMGTNGGMLLMILSILFLAACTIMLVFSVTTVALFFNRRDTFPKVYITFNKALIALSIMFPVFSAIPKKTPSDTIGTQAIMLLLSIATSIVCILYLQKSERVKNTFVFTYPEHMWTKALIRHYNKKLTSHSPKQKIPATTETQKDEHENI